MSTPEQSAIIKEANTTLSRLANQISICKDYLGFPKSGIVPSHDFGKCLDLAAQSEIIAPTSTTSAKTTAAITKAAVELVENL